MPKADVYFWSESTGLKTHPEAEYQVEVEKDAAISGGTLVFGYVTAWGHNIFEVPEGTSGLFWAKNQADIRAIPVTVTNSDNTRIDFRSNSLFTLYPSFDFSLINPPEILGPKIGVPLADRTPVPDGV
jgi:malic enzyme